MDSQSCGIHGDEEFLSRSFARTKHSPPAPAPSPPAPNLAGLSLFPKKWQKCSSMWDQAVRGLSEILCTPISSGLYFSDSIITGYWAWVLHIQRYSIRPSECQQVCHTYWEESSIKRCPEGLKIKQAELFLEGLPNSYTWTLVPP